jgi:single-strand DNA-binding protein
MYKNSVTLIGNITRDIELKALPTGMKIANFSIATNRTWKDKTGAKKDETEFHNLVAFGRTAEVIQQYCHKGDQILVDGRIHTSSWDDKTSGAKRYKTEIMVENFQFGQKKGQNAPRTDDGTQNDRTPSYPDEQASTGQNTPETGAPQELSKEDIESIPF